MQRILAPDFPISPRCFPRLSTADAPPRFVAQGPPPQTDQRGHACPRPNRPPSRP